MDFNAVKRVSIDIEGALCTAAYGSLFYPHLLKDQQVPIRHFYLYLVSPRELSYREVFTVVQRYVPAPRRRIVVVNMPSGTIIEPSPPTNMMDPYKVLEIEENATSAEIKSAYKKLALLKHPDKVPESTRDAAHLDFQTLAHAYAILSDPNLRKRYDTTGNTSVTSSTDNFNWQSFYASQYAEAVTLLSISTFAATYKGSDEEKQDVLDVYTKCHGVMNKLYEFVVLSNPLDDEDRFRMIIDQAIAAGAVRNFDAYKNETAGQKQKRMAKARKELKRFEKENDKRGDSSSLQALIQQRHKGNSAASIIDNIAAKYAPKTAGKKRKATEEPPEEAFAATRARMRKNRASAAKQEVVDEEDEDDEEEDDDEEYEEEAPKAKGKKKAAPRKGISARRTPSKATRARG